MSILLKEDETYRNWINDISSRFRRSQIKASVHVNQEMLLFYWSLGRDVSLLKAESRWGTGFINQLSQDLRNELPDVKGFSRTNLFYIIKFYNLYKDFAIVPQLEGQLPTKINNVENDISPIFCIPWGHHKLIIDRCKDNVKKALFFVTETLQHGWSRAVLLNYLDTNLYERTGKAITNFSQTLPMETSDLAQEITKDPYNFDFLSLTKTYYEKELKDALMNNLINSLSFRVGNWLCFCRTRVQVSYWRDRTIYRHAFL